MKSREILILIVLLKIFIISFYFFYPSIVFQTNYLNVLMFNQMETDIGYYPLVLEYSKLNFSPTFLEEMTTKKFVSFPFLPIIIQSFFYKVFGNTSFIISIYLFNSAFYLFLYFFFKKIFKDRYKSVYVIVGIIFFTVFFKYISNNFDSNDLKNVYYTFENNFGFRYPRPLITSPVLFVGLYLLFSFKKNFFEKFKRKYILFLIIISGLLLHLFFYYFVIFNILLLILFIKDYHKDKINLLKIKKIFLPSFLVFIFFGSAFIFQQINIEHDNAERIGLIDLNFEKRVFLLKYFLTSFFKIKLFLLIILTGLFFYFSNNKFYTSDKYSFNVIFYFIISSFLSICIFILFSPKIISLYHFLSIFIFSLIFYIFLNLFFILFEILRYTNLEKKIYNPKVIIFSTLLILILNIFSIKNYYDKNSDKIIEITKIDNFLKSNKLNNTNNILFTFDLKVANLWLLFKNKNLIISEGFSHTLKNAQVENNLINTLKIIGWGTKDFKEFLSFGKTSIRDHRLMYLFTYKYQANSLYTFSNIENYLEDYRSRIKKTSPFRVQNQVMPEDEKYRLLQKFQNHYTDLEIAPDYIILNNTYNKTKNFLIKNPIYSKIFSSNMYEIFERKKN